MVYYIEEYGEDDTIEKVPEDVTPDQSFTEVVANGLGFLGGPAWHYPEEEIEFFPIDEIEDRYELEGEYEIEDDDADESYSCTSMDNFRLALIENYVGSHDIQLDDDDIFCTGNSSTILAPPQSLSSAASGGQEIENNSGTKQIDESNHDNFEICERRCHINGSSEISPLDPDKKRHYWTSNVPRKRIRNVNDSMVSREPVHIEQQLRHFREATLCVPFEYKTKLATFYIRRPYGIVTVPDIFRGLCPQTTDEEYEKQSRVSSSQTIQVAIAVSADNSLMLLYGSSGLRYKTDPSDIYCDTWIDVPDVGSLDIPLGYVNIENHDRGNKNIEYSLDEILEEAMLVREQYCSTIRSAALEVEKHKSVSTTKVQSPPSLAKSIVSTPNRSNYYYDGSSNNIQVEGEHEEELRGRKLDFFNCVSPSLRTGGSHETECSESHHLSNRLQQEKWRQRRFCRFFQRLIIVVGFYCSGIFLVTNLSAVNYNRSSNIAAMLSNDFITGLLSDSAGEHHRQIKKNKEDEELSKVVFMKDDSSLPFRIAAFFSSTTATSYNETDCRASIATATDKNHNYISKLEIAEKSLREKEKQNSGLIKKYNLEREKAKKLEKEKQNTEVLVKNLRREAETFAVNLDLEQEKQRKLEETIRELESQIMVLKQERFHVKDESVEVKSVEVPNKPVLVEFVDKETSVGENRSLNDKEYLSSKIEPSTVRDNMLLESSQNSMQSIENVILQSARAKKGPIIPRVFRQIKRLTPQFGIDQAHERPRGMSTSHTSVQLFASSFKHAIAHNLEKIGKRSQSVNTNDIEKSLSRIDLLTLSMGGALKKEDESVHKTTHRSSESIRLKIKKNVEEVSTAGIRKMDQGQEAMNAIGDFAKEKLQSVGKRVRIFAFKKWKLRRS